MTNTFLDALKNADHAFLTACAKALNDRQSYVTAEVKRGATTSWLEYEGTDRSDMALGGVASLVMTSAHDVTVTVGFDSALRGHGDDSVRLKVGELNVDTVVRMIERNIGL